MNLSAQPVSLPPFALGGDSKAIPMNVLGKAFSLTPSLTAQAADQVVMGSYGLNHLNKSLNPLFGMPSHSNAELQTVAKNFESIFMNMLMKEMRDSVQKSDLMGNSQGMEFFQSMYDQQLTERLASAGGLGIGRLVYDRLQQVTLPHQKTFS